MVEACEYDVENNFTTQRLSVATATIIVKQVR